MYTKLLSKTLLSAALCTACATVAAQNPFIQTRYTADPAPMVKGETLYVYADVDEPKADFFWMYQWRVYSTTDMVNWTDHGEVMGLNTFSWADDRAWATQCIERNGKYYWYVCAHSKLSGGMAIGVAVADNPTGPFKDALGKPLYDDGKWDNIDPTVLIDKKGAYLVWGNPEIHQAKLNEDMVSFDGEVTFVNQTEKSFGAPSPRLRERGKKYIDVYTEGPWLSQRGKNYYLLYAAGGVPEHIAYSMGKSALGPWIYKGTIMPKTDTNSFTNHCGIVDFKGNSYFFYHTGKLPGGGGFNRSMAVEQFKYNADGTIPTIMPTAEGVSPVGTLNPYRVVEAETMAFSKGVSTEQNSKDGVYVTAVHNGDWIKLREVDFGDTSPANIKFCVASGSQGGKITVYADSIGGKALAITDVHRTEGWEKWTTETVNLQRAITGKHDLYFYFSGQKGRELMNINWWQMIK